MSKVIEAPDLGALLQQFFTEYLIQQRAASPCTIASYRDTFCLLFAFAERKLGKRAAALGLENITAELILEFLEYLEKERHNSIRTRNVRCAAIRSFMHYVASKAPFALAITQPVLAILMKRFERPLVGFLSREQIQAVLAAPDPNTWSGHRDRVMFATLYNTGARVSELTGMCIGDLCLTPTASVHIRGKGRKERSVPLWRSTASQLRRWLRHNPGAPERALFPNRGGGEMSRVSVSDRLKRAAQTAAQQLPELATRRISPHLVRHSTAMHLLQSGVDITVIALWLGHESPATTHAYIYI
jgi:integrase/recombinase XerD